jgi:prevent-host-death family protein
MIRTVSVTEFRRNLRRYIEQVRLGDDLVITERGRVIARVESIPEDRSEKFSSRDARESESG